MGKPRSHKNLSSCILAAIFLILLIAAAFVVYFTVFRPRDPKLTVNSVQLPAFSAANSTVSFTFSQYVTISNPNHAAFTHYDSSLQMLYAGNQVGLLFIPAGKISGGRTQYMAATFSVKSFPLTVPVQQQSVGPAVPNGHIGFEFGPGMEVETRLELAGRVNFLHFFTHRVEARAECRVAIGVTDGSVLGFHC
ncbi:hypothetical protein F511_00563 [Dorcoceras hygrometricum]|uniref:Late embryogenesis abundant protein LEA-2 subgroup domain-containing protein n=1 Tax=Dorcoceras hygrometricum TaxID=472368 RepID=A0A2Z7BEA4_9LAMI|nr:hypothetical protein F511_00563 [Dorcoceras hygrometricum]